MAVRNRYVALVLQLLILLNVFQSGDNFRCYICDSKSNSHCEDPVSVGKLEMMDCEDFVPVLAMQLNISIDISSSSMLYGCQKLKVEDHKGDHVIVRTCAVFENDSSAACDGQDNFRGFEVKYKIQFCGVCESELCNSSLTTETSNILLFITFVALCIMGGFTICKIETVQIL